MPFKSRKQEKWMWATHPAMAKRWEAQYGTFKKAKTPKKKKK